MEQATPGCPPASAAVQVAGLVVHDAQQPGPESAGAAEPGQRGMCLHECVLNHVIGVGACSHNRAIRLAIGA